MPACESRPAPSPRLSKSSVFFRYSTASQPSTQQPPSPILNSTPYRIQLLNLCLPTILYSIPAQYSRASQPNTTQHPKPNSGIQLVSSSGTLQHPSLVLSNILAQYSSEIQFFMLCLPPIFYSIQAHYSTASQPNTQQHPVPNSVIKLVSSPGTLQHPSPLLNKIPTQSSALHTEFSY